MTNKDDKTREYIVCYTETEHYKVIIEATSSDKADEKFIELYDKHKINSSHICTEMEVTDIEELKG